VNRATLGVNEMFGPTVQGEGKSVGMPCHFLRLAGCNLACVWCDTPYTWDWSRFDPKQEVHPTPVGDVVEALQRRGVITGVRNLVVSGGEPMLQQAALSEVVHKLVATGWRVEIETAGTVMPDWDAAWALRSVAQWNVSPKLAHSGNPLEKRMRAEVLAEIAHTARATFKFVVQDLKDFEEIDTIMQVVDAAVAPHLRRVYVMPEGVTREQIDTHLTDAIVEAAVSRGFWVTPRLHVAIWGTRRGV
jgi:7-carboxy-7-deazaguanine synthase